jgi:diadenosine tetraphosphate (Ap4A) HIT family hydrolase
MVKSIASSRYNDCEFCDEFAGGNANSFATRYGTDIPSRTLLDHGGFRILPSLGQIVPGYLLLVPICHYVALADMPIAELRTADVLRRDLADQMRHTYGDCLFFEHGVRTGEAGGCGISHAHLHIVPFPAKKDPVEDLCDAYTFEKLSNLTELKNIQPGKSYLYYESVRGVKYVFYPSFVPSQHVRRLLAEALGLQTWDWHCFGKEEKFFETLAQSSRLCAALPY